MSPQQFGYYEDRQWEVDSGTYAIKVGACSVDIRLTDQVTLTDKQYVLLLRTVYFSEMQPVQLLLHFLSNYNKNSVGRK